MGDLPLGVIRSGPPPGPDTDAFLLLHGYGASSFTWRHWKGALEERGHLVQVDLKGSGTAPRPDDGRYGPHHQAELVHRLVEELELERLTLVGHSLGGWVALMTALRILDDRLLAEDGAARLRTLVLVASPAYPQKLPPFVTAGRWPRLAGWLLRLGGISNVVRWTLRRIVYDADVVTAGMVAGYAGPLDDAGARRALLATAARIVPPELDRTMARYPEIDLPTLLLWGREDPVIPLWVGRRLEQDLPRARLEILERCGHSPPDERPEASLARVLAFLDEQEE